MAVEFPSAIGGDIASDGADGWNGFLSDAAVEASFSGNGARYTASDDVTLGVVSVSGSSVFSLAGRNVKMGGFHMIGRSRDTLFSGGILDVSNNGFWSCGQQGAYSGTSRLTVANGCMVTNASEIRISYKDSGNAFMVSEGSKVYADTVLLGVNASCSNRIEVTSGGELHVKTHFNDGGIIKLSDLSGASTENSLIVDGEGALYECLGETRIGRYFGRNRFEAKNGAKVRMETLYVGGKGQPSSGNAARFENADVSCWRSALAVHYGSASNEVWIGGREASFSAKVNNNPRYPFFGEGGHNRFTLADHVVWEYPLSMALDTAASNNTLSVIGGAELSVAGVLFSGTNHVRSCNNAIFVGDGGKLAVAGLHIGRFGNGVTVSNATLVATSSKVSNSGVRIGVKMANVDAASIFGNRLVLQGTSPSVRSENAVTIENGSELRFEVPANGYDADVVPIQSKRFVVDDTSCIRAIGVRTLQSRIGGTRSMALVRSAEPIAVGDAILASANGALANEGCVRARFSIADGGRELRLTVPVTGGTVVVVR